MDTSFVGATDPAPFVAAAYSIGTIGIFGFFLWTIFEQRKLRRLLVAVRRTPHK